MVKPLTLSDLTPTAWESAVGTRRTPMLQRIWAEAYGETLANGDIETFVVGPPGKPRALAPFARPRNGANRLTLLGAEDLWESIEIAAQDDASEAALARTLAKSGKPLRFGHYPTDGAFLDALKTAYRGHGRVVAKPVAAGEMPRIQLDTSWATPEAKLSSRRRSDLRRMARNAGKTGAVAYEIRAIDAGDPALDSLIDEAFAVEERNWKGRSGTAMAVDGNKGKFYRAYAHKAAAAGLLRLCFLRIDGTAAAMQFAVEYDDAFWLLKIGYDDRFKRCSPGNLLMRETIAYAAKKGLARYEFLGKEASWTTLWASDARPIAAVRTYPYNLAGAAALVGDAAALVRGRIKARITKAPDDVPPAPAKTAGATLHA